MNNPVKIAVLTWFVSTVMLSAQTFQVIHNFTDLSSPNVWGKLLLSDNTLYGTTAFGGTAGVGSVFKINTNGTGYQVIKSFPPTTTNTNSDGVVPFGGLVMCSNKLFGTANGGGSWGKGTVFGLNTNGTGFSVLTQFDGTNGKAPYVGLTVSGNLLYGTTAGGGISNKGAIFQVNADGTGFALVKSFFLGEGFLPLSPVTLSPDGTTLYGATYNGGLSNRGTIYSIGTNGSGFTTLKTFSDGNGLLPRNGLVLSGNTLYGTTEGDAAASNSIVYRVNIDATGDGVIKRFSEPDPNLGTNDDGSTLFPGGLVMWNGVLYGTARYGGTNGNGVAFKMNPDGTGYAVLKHFAAITSTNGGAYINVGGVSPLAELMVADGVLYGTTKDGGSSGRGTIFSITIPPTPPLQTTNLAGHTVIFWSDDGLNRSLRTTADLNATVWTNITSLNWTNSSSTPRQIGYQISAVSNAPAAFFRLQ